MIIGSVVGKDVPLLTFFGTFNLHGSIGYVTEVFICIYGLFHVVLCCAKETKQWLNFVQKNRMDCTVHSREALSCLPEMKLSGTLLNSFLFFGTQLFRQNPLNRSYQSGHLSTTFALAGPSHPFGQLRPLPQVGAWPGR